MKRHKLWIFGAILATLFAGLLVRHFLTDKGYEMTEYLFDTQCTITAYGKNAKDAVSEAFDAIVAIHKDADFFDENSLVSKINSAPKGEKVKVNKVTIEILKVSLELERKSEGAFDVCAAPLTTLWKTAIENEKIPTESEISEAVTKTENSGIVIDEKNLTVAKLTDDTKIDLGGAAKGYAGDLAVSVLKKFGAESGIVDLGGNINCFGKNPKTKEGKWRIGLQNPFKPMGDFTDTVELNEGAVVTSGTYQRYFEKDGERFHHIIDPKTGKPSNKSYESVTVVGDNALVCDCLATAIFILGEDKGRSLAAEYGAEIYFK